MPMPTHRLCLPIHHASVPAARRCVDAVLAAWRLRHLSEDATLITSELVTNSVQHGHLGWGDVFDLTLQRRDRALYIEIADACQWELPRPRRPAPDELGGRGLTLVGALSQGWGVTPRPLGTAVWARLAIEMKAPAEVAAAG